MGVNPKIGDFTPKWMVYNGSKPYEQMDDLGGVKSTPIFGSTPIYTWLFQLDDSKSLHEKWLFHQTSIKKWLFGVPGIY